MANSQQIKEGKDICFPQQDSNHFSLRSTALNRRHSADGTIGSGSASERAPADRFHPYRRQFSDGAGDAAGCLQQSTSSFSSLQEVSSPDTRSCSCDVQTTWGEYNGSIQSSYSELPAVPVEPYSSLSQSYASYSSVRPMQQVSSKLYPNADQPDGSKYSLQSLSIQPHQERSTEALFPKPIYSYSILIFMALKNSKTGSLPVSEIYSFMTEHFPYFKTAPDGWKNSVRHNLSLNKCFEKVENKNGSTSRKGCLWALNPAKVEKMQEELHKWRRKDPQTIRRSMAKPEDFDHLLGEKPDKLRSLPPYPNTNTATSKRAGPMYSPTRSPLNPPPACRPVRQTEYSHRQLHQPYYLPHATVQPSNPFALYSPCGQQSAAGVPSPSGCLDSPIAGKMPPVYSFGLLGEYNVGLRGMHELLPDGDTSYDIDTLNPSLTDLQLQGNLWEELREDSLVSEPNGPTTNPSTSFPLQGHHLQTSCPQAPLAFSPTFEGSPGPRCKAAYEDEDADRSCWNGLHPVGYSGLESLAGYLTSCTTSVSLM